MQHGQRLVGVSFMLSLASGCVFHDDKPDPESLFVSPDCEAVNGRYAFRSAEDGKTIALSLFDEETEITELVVTKTELNVAIEASDADAREYGPVFYSRYDCGDSVLKMIVFDEATTGGIGMDTSNRVMEMFVTDSGLLNIRFVDTTMGFVYILPYYASSDDLYTLERIR